VDISQFARRKIGQIRACSGGGLEIRGPSVGHSSGRAGVAVGLAGVRVLMIQHGPRVVANPGSHVRSQIICG
jgi:hypothetical protein